MLTITQKVPTKFSYAVWVGSVGGAALPLDPDPNVTPPAANRILKWTAKRGGLMVMGSSGFGAFVRATQVGGLNAGTNITVTTWIYDDAQARWFPHGTILNITGTSNTGTPGGMTFGNMAGAKFFVQITANPGSTPLFGYDLN